MSRVIKNLLTFGCILAFGRLGLPQSARASSADLDLSITVHVFNYAELSPKTLQRAEAVAAHIFGEVEIETAWLDCSPFPPQAQNLPSCPGTLRPTEFALRIHFRNRAAQAGFPESWLGYAMPPAEDGGRSSHASVFFDRVLDLAKSGNASVPVILGHAMAHELGHLLMPSVGHTSSGLMRGKWSPSHLQLAAQGQLHFTSQQAEIIRAEVLARSAESNPSQELRIELHVYNYAGVAGSELARAHSEAARVLQQTGIAVTWVNCVVPGKGATNAQACPSADGQAPALVLHILPRAMAERAARDKGSLGFALLADDGGPAYVAFVFYHCVASLAVELCCARGLILGYALAHEVGHLLLGINSHSSWGIMRACWSREDFQHIATGRFTFAPEQAQVIRAQVKLRVMAQGAPRVSELRSAK